MDNIKENIVYGPRVPLKKAAFNIFIAIMVINVILVIIFAVTFRMQMSSLINLFHLDIEKNIPSSYSALLFIYAGYVAFTCIAVEKKYIGKFSAEYMWLIIGLILWFMAVDEYMSLHEQAGSLLVDLKLLSTGGEPLIGGYVWAWTAIGVPLVLAVGLPSLINFHKIFLEFKKLYYLIIMAAFLFLFGALGMENMQVYVSNNFPEISTYIVLIVEEFMEMTGIALAIFVLLQYRREQLSSLKKT